MDIKKKITVAMGALSICIQAFCLTCPSNFQFHCVPVDAHLCPHLENPTLCTISGIGQTWDFVAPSRPWSSNHPVAYTPGKSSCSILPERTYSASYLISYYGEISDGEGGRFNGAYCMYILNGELSLTGLLSRDYINDAQHGDWQKTEYGVACQGARECEYKKILA